MENASVRRVRMMNNRPTLLLDGADTLPLIYALSDFPGADSRTYQAQKNIAAFRQMQTTYSYEKKVLHATNVARSFYDRAHEIGQLSMEAYHD